MAAAAARFAKGKDDKGKQFRRRVSPGAAGFLDLLSAFMPAPLADCVDTSRRWYETRPPAPTVPVHI